MKLKSLAFNNSLRNVLIGQNRNKFVPKKPEIMTPAGGNPIAAGQGGPLLMQDYQLLEKLAHQNRERISEWTVPAKGTAAYGTLTTTHEIVQWPCPGAVKGKFLAARS